MTYMIKKLNFSYDGIGFTLYNCTFEPAVAETELDPAEGASFDFETIELQGDPLRQDLFNCLGEGILTSMDEQGKSWFERD